MTAAFIIKKSKMVSGRFSTSRPEMRVWNYGLGFVSREEAEEKAEVLRAELGTEWTVWVTTPDD